ncbi:MAG: response regulator [Gemmatimonadaceae bacterium]
MTGDLIRVVLVDDHAVVRAGLKAILAGARDVDVVGEAENGRDALVLIQRLAPDVAVMDISMPDLDGAEATKRIVADGLRTRILILTMHAEDDYLVPLLSAGAAGFLMKSAADRELLDAVRAVARGEVYVRPAAAALLARNLTRKNPLQSDRDRFERLTEREREVLRYTAQGHSAPEIGEKLRISPKTVDTYKQRIHEKVGLAHRTEYVQFALRLGLLHEG